MSTTTQERTDAVRAVVDDIRADAVRRQKAADALVLQGNRAALRFYATVLYPGATESPFTLQDELWIPVTYDSGKTYLSPIEEWPHADLLEGVPLSDLGLPDGILKGVHEDIARFRLAPLLARVTATGRVVAARTLLT